MGRKKETKRVLRYVTALIQALIGWILILVFNERIEIDTITKDSILALIISIVGFIWIYKGVNKIMKQIK